MEYSSSESVTSDFSFHLSPLCSHYDRSRSPTPFYLDEVNNLEKRKSRTESDCSENKDDLLPADPHYTYSTHDSDIISELSESNTHTFPTNSWLSGKEYLMMMDNIGQYRIYDNLGVSTNGTPLQPRFIYTDPKECIYFLKCSSLTGRNSFAFPQESGLEKKYVWKKMGFTTDIPIEAPLVRYVTASCYKKGDKKVKSNGLFRIHACIRLYYKDGKYEQIGDYVLVHIRQFVDKT